MSYFTDFPIINYRGKYAPNLLAAVRMSIEMRRATSLYHPYTIAEGDRPDNLADLYYGDPEADWVIYMANNIIDIEAQWPLDADVFNAYMIRKYGSDPAKHYEPIHYTLRVDIPPISEAQYSAIPNELRKYWSYDINTKRMHVTNMEATMTIAAYNRLSAGEKVYWKPVSAHQAEFDRNEQKRNIRLIDKRYLQAIKDELKKALNDR